MSMLAYSDGPPPTRRMIGLGVAVGVHALLIWALMSGLARDVIEAVQEPLEVALIAEPPAPALPAPPPEIVKPKEAYVPPPKAKVAPPVAPQNTIKQLQMEKPEVVPVVRDPAPAIPQAIPAQGNTQPPYPPASRRNGEEGRVGLLLYVSESGKVTDGKIESSSGFERLDRVALIHARRKWTFKPAILNGQPVGHWMRYSVIFKLTD